MPLDRKHTAPMYLMGRLAALAETTDDRLPTAVVDQALIYPLKALPEIERRIIAAGNGSLAEEVFELITPSAMPDGPVKIEMQGDYWVGYYHQRGYPRQVKATRDDLEEAGRALFGSRWQTDMAEMLGYSDAARLRAILRGDRALAGGALADLVAELRQRSAQTAAIADRLETLLQPRSDG